MKIKEQPNILIIIADQFAQSAVGAYGNRIVQTPNIDRIAENGVRFSNSYNTCPLCQPVRASFWTGRYPHETGVTSNGKNYPVPLIPESMPTLGSIFSDGGYETVHFGKKHDADSLRGFICEEEKELPVEGTEAWPVQKGTARDRYTTVKTVEFLKGKHDKPFLAVTDLVNPHDICGWVGENQGPHKDKPIPVELPPLQDNFEIHDLANRPLPIQYLCCTHNRLCQGSNWSDTNYRYYIAAYYHYINRVDAEIGLILDALYSTPAGENTLVLFMADHGDGMGMHRMITKGVSFYEETTRIPFIFSGSGISVKNGEMLEEPLVSLLDLLPTLCDYARLPVPDDLHGVSLMPWLMGKKPENAHEYVASEWHTEWGYTISPGRMLRTERYKYTRYIEGNGEELYDLVNDPGETRTLIHDTKYAAVLEEHRELLNKHLKKTNDDFLNLSYKVDKRWRSHKLGYPNHKGPAAPMVE